MHLKHRLSKNTTRTWATTATMGKKRIEKTKNEKESENTIQKHYYSVLNFAIRLRAMNSDITKGVLIIKQLPSNYSHTHTQNIFQQWIYRHVNGKRWWKIVNWEMGNMYVWKCIWVFVDLALKSFSHILILLLIIH